MHKPLITKAIIPAAGFGTRMLPASKAVPKEMFPIVDRPVIEYVVEEAAASGITDVLFVISRHKRALEEHFQPIPDVELALKESGQFSLLQALQRSSQMVRCHFVWQMGMRGLGDAIYQGRSFVGDQPFAVLLGDCIVTSTSAAPVTAQLVAAHHEFGGSVVAVEEVPIDRVSRYGIVGGTPIRDGLWEVDQIIEKPRPELAPSRLAVSARYVFTPSIFESLATQIPGRGGEIQLTDSMASQIGRQPLTALLYEGTRHDVGDILGFLKANITLALDRDGIGDALASWMASTLSSRSTN
jgi:UTP--glucose-1-phosphate uridylyltransferase